MIERNLKRNVQYKFVNEKKRHRRIKVKKGKRCIQKYSIFTKALGVELFANGAYASLSRLPRLKLIVELFLQIDNVQSSCRSARNILHLNFYITIEIITTLL